MRAIRPSQAQRLTVRATDCLTQIVNTRTLGYPPLAIPEFWPPTNTSQYNLMQPTDIHSDNVKVNEQENLCPYCFKPPQTQLVPVVMPDGRHVMTTAEVCCKARDDWNEWRRLLREERANSAYWENRFRRLRGFVVYSLVMAIFLYIWKFGLTSPAALCDLV